MKSCRSALESLGWRVFCLGATLTLFTLEVCSLPSLAETPYSDTQFQEDNPTLLTKQQRSRRWIEIDLSRQRLVAWSGKTAHYVFTISSGKRSTPTPTGTYTIQSKYRSSRMRGRGYDIPNVPYAMYYSGGYALHGASWHNRFGSPVSHGCINLRVGEARLLYKWASIGTRVVVHR